MTQRGKSPAPAAAARAVSTAAALIVLAVVAAYANSLHGAFLLDDEPSILRNASIRHLWPLSVPLHPPGEEGVTVQGRPFLNLTLAFNYALGGTAAIGYHLFNLAVHGLACLLLFGVVRRTLDRCGERLRKDSALLAGACALLWGVHPLQTESVTYVVQRAESLMGLLFLASLYGAVRAWEEDRRLAWSLASVAAALLCAATKEVAAALPLMVVLYDRAFFAESFAEAWRRRRLLYLGLAASWIPLLLLVWSSGSRGGSIGSEAGIGSWDYALSQSRGIFHYLRLCFWPSPLIFDYGSEFVPFGRALPWALALLALLGAVAWAWRRRPALGFLGAWFFVILAPTSSFVGGTRQMWAEHRMYLPLAAVVVGAVLLLHRYLGRSAFVVIAAAALALLAATVARNRTYGDPRLIWRGTVALRPDNPWAQTNLGRAIAERTGGGPEALACFEAAVRLKPGLPVAQYNLGTALALLPGRRDEALRHIEEALRIQPKYPDAQMNLGVLLAGDPARQAEAISHLETAVRLEPGYARAHYDLGMVLARQPGGRARALEEIRADLSLDPGDAKGQAALRRLLADPR